MSEKQRPASEEHVHRLAALRARLSELSLHAALITHVENIAYLSGFTSSEAALVVSPRDAILISDFRYALQAREESPDFEFRQAAVRTVDGIADVIRAASFGVVGFESAQVTYDTFTTLSDRLTGVSLTPVRDLVERLRMVKDDSEVAAIRRAAVLADAAMAHVESLLRAGAVEIQVAIETEAFLRREGSQPLPFDLIIASGERAALPHATSGERTMSRGDLVVVDLGARVDGYCSDLTRTVVIGKPTDRQREIYRLVWQAQRRGLEAVRAGAVAVEVDAAARSFIAERGYGEQFGHGLGHGVGREVHEAPRLGKQSRDDLAAGMVVTVEPGVYIEGWGGVRIEDLVLVTEDGCEVLSAAPKPDELRSV